MKFIFNALPALLTVFLTLVEGLAWRLPPEMLPLLTLSTIYYWTLYRPDLLTPLVVFLAGLLLDILEGNPTGLSPLLFLAIYGFLRQKRRLWTTFSFSDLWVRYALVICLVQGVHFLLSSALQGQWNTPIAFALPGVVTWAIYPYLSLFFSWIHKGQMRGEDA